MTDLGINIVGKDGKIVENLKFSDYDEIADYMLDAADKWYDGLQDVDQQIVFNRSENGEIVYSDTSSFSGDVDGFESGDDGDIEVIGGDFEEVELFGSEDGEDS